MEEKNDIKKRWIKCSVIGFLIAFGVSMFVMEGQQISLIQGNSYYLSSVSVFLETIFEPVKGSIVAEIICQIVFWVIEFIMPKEKKITQKTLTIPIVSNIISFIIVAFVIISNIQIIF